VINAHNAPGRRGALAWPGGSDVDNRSGFRVSEASALSLPLPGTSWQRRQPEGRRPGCGGLPVCGWPRSESSVHHTAVPCFKLYTATWARPGPGCIATRAQTVTARLILRLARYSGRIKSHTQPAAQWAG
jgi:hypothetical protein